MKNVLFCVHSLLPNPTYADVDDAEILGLRFDSAVVKEGHRAILRTNVASGFDHHYSQFSLENTS